MPARLLPLALASLALAVSACGSDADGGSAGSAGGGGGGGGAQTVTTGDVIGMRDLEFQPADAVVRVGQTVVWRNDESTPHDVVATSGATFKSNVFGKDRTFSWKATKPGTVKYECTLHPGMDGTLTVR